MWWLGGRGAEEITGITKGLKQPCPPQSPAWVGAPGSRTSCLVSMSCWSREERRGPAHLYKARSRVLHPAAPQGAGSHSPSGCRLRAAPPAARPTRAPPPHPLPLGSHPVARPRPGPAERWAGQDRVNPGLQSPAHLPQTGGVGAWGQALESHSPCGGTPLPLAAQPGGKRALALSPTGVGAEGAACIRAGFSPGK